MDQNTIFRIIIVTFFLLITEPLEGYLKILVFGYITHLLSMEVLVSYMKKAKFKNLNSIDITLLIILISFSYFNLDYPLGYEN